MTSGQRWNDDDDEDRPMTGVTRAGDGEFLRMRKIVFFCCAFGSEFTISPFFYVS
jgi:hypothetical protein